MSAVIWPAIGAPAKGRWNPPADFARVKKTPGGQGA